jgi:tRNA-splicing ligase RtcB
MADAHVGYGGPIGAVIPTTGAIIPYAVGVDIGCGMAAVKLRLTASQLPDDLTPLLSLIEEVVPAGVGQGHETYSKARAGLHSIGGEHAPKLTDKQYLTARRQMGTLGSGNHFVEVCLDPDENVWVVLHSGSRGIGNQLAQHHIGIAKGLMAEYFIELEDPNLAYLVQGTNEFKRYWDDLQWAQSYAARNRETMLFAVLEVVEDFIGLDDNYSLQFDEPINCHHNYTALEYHRGKDIYVTRKGAIRARVGDLGIIPGSMGTSSYIVEGLGNEASYTSAPHGAGRRMSRRKAKETFTEADLSTAMEGKTWLDDRGGAFIDEIPGSYKDIDTVLRDSADLVEVKVELSQILNYKGN